MLVGPSKQLKQIIQTEHHIVKSPISLEANQLAIFKRGRGFELGATVKQNPASGQIAAGLGVRCADHSVTLTLKTDKEINATVAKKTL